MSLGEYWLHAKLAGNNYPFGVPYALSPDEWVVIDDENAGTDFAATALPELLVANLRAGGIEPIQENAWGTSRFVLSPM